MEQVEQMNQADQDKLKSQEKQSKRIFWIRFAAYVTIGWIAPILFLIIRFNLFRPTTGIAIGGWGVVVILFTTIFMAKLITQAVESIESVLGKQILLAIRKVFLPLFAVTFSLWALNGFMTEAIQFLSLLTVCEPIAYVVNPLPAMAKDAKEKRDESKIKKVVKIFWDSKE